MIEEVLRKDFVLAQLERVRRELERAEPGRRRRGAPALDEELTADDIQIARDMTRAAAEAEQPSPPPVTGRRRGRAELAPSEEPYVARDPVISLLQSALEEYAEEHLELQPVLPPAPARRGQARADVPAVTHERLRTGRG